MNRRTTIDELTATLCAKLGSGQSMRQAVEALYDRVLRLHGLSVDAGAPTLLTPREARKQEARAVVRQVADAYGVAMPRLIGPTKRQHPDMVAIRWTACLVLRHLGYSYPEIGEVLRIDHTTALNACRQGERKPAIKAAAEQMAEQLNPGRRAA